MFSFSVFFSLHQSLVPFVKAVAEHLLSWPPFKWPDHRVYEEENCVCVTESEKEYKCLSECMSACARECVLGYRVCSCWGSPPDGRPLFPLSMSLALSVSVPDGLWAFPFPQCTPQLNLCPWTQAFHRV